MKTPDSGDHVAGRLSVPFLLATVAASVSLQAQLTSHSFGSGANTFTLDFVTIGNPGNSADTTVSPSMGAVPYVYRMGKHEVSRDMIEKANNAGGLGISLADMTSYGGNGVNRPATGVSWNEAARFVNWLNESKGYSPAYKFGVQPSDAGYDANGNISLWTVGDAGYNAGNPYRNSLAHFFLPSENEWFKAAYYDPIKIGGGGYWVYPTGSDTAPIPTAGSTNPGEAVYNGQSGPADINNAGGLSPYGTMGQGGNVVEWHESAWDGANDEDWELRSAHGGYWSRSASRLGASYRSISDPTLDYDFLGFRVAAAVPEPLESAGVIGVAALGFALWRRWGSL